MWWSTLAITLSARLLARSEVIRLPLPLAGRDQGFRASNLAITGFTTPPLSAMAWLSWALLGTVATVGMPTASLSPSYEANQKVLFFTTGPPSEKPNWLL